MDHYFRLNAGGVFAQTDTPIAETPDRRTAIFDAGFAEQLASNVEFAGDVTLYMREEKPRFLVDVWGIDAQIVCIVADDVPHLILTMKEIGPLIALVQGSQADAMRDIRGLR